MKSTSKKSAIGLAMAALLAGGAGAEGLGRDDAATGLSSFTGSWTTYRDFWFDANSAEIRLADQYKASDIAGYLSRNPEQQVAIDGSAGTNSADFSNRRVSTVRDALLKAGVPADRIQTGAFGNQKVRRDRWVEVLVSSR